MEQLTTSELRNKIENGENFVLDLYATWCGPCKVMLNNLSKVNESVNLQIDQNTVSISLMWIVIWIS